MAESKEPLRLLRDELATPLGRLVIISEESGALRLVSWLDEHPRAMSGIHGYATDPCYSVVDASNPGGATQALRRYFDGDLSALDNLQVASLGTTFQRNVWRALRTIGYGTTLSYVGLARRIQHPTAVRAVGLANARNPIALVVPCHRVIGANGSLTGYAAGLHRKRWLLEHEHALSARELPFAAKA